MDKSNEELDFSKKQESCEFDLSNQLKKMSSEQNPKETKKEK